MPPLAGFTDNSFRTHADLITASYALLEPLHAYKSPGGARIKIPVETGTHFDETAAQLEGFARSLWVVAPLLALEKNTEHKNALQNAHLSTFPEGLIAGTTPDVKNEYWGPIQNTDQRMVEMEILSFALLCAPTSFLPSTDIAKMNLITWLQNINGKTIPTNNWLWFRVLTNLALVKTCGVPYETLRESIAADLKVLDSFEMGEGNGWNSDGVWGEGGRQADYYSGSFAIQFSQLLFVKFASDLDPERAKKYKKRAGLFALDFMRYFDADGAAIPFGRSLTYRFAMGGFWSVAAYVGITLPAPLDSPGVVKGLLLRHLRYWAAKPAIFHADGTLNIGFAYPNSYMCEDYNSPQSVYWCLKTLICVGLPSSHPFWTCDELPHPLFPPNMELEVTAIKPPLQIVCNTPNHTFFLSSGQFCGWPLKATEAKYSKFAYSSAFGFSVPTGSLIQQIASDSTLALSNDDGETWRIRWKSTKSKIKNVVVETPNGKEEMPGLVSIWKPWKLHDISVRTTLIPPTKYWPDWHMRIHRIRVPASGKHRITAMEGGFAIFGRQEGNGLNLLDINLAAVDEAQSGSMPEGRYESQGEALVISRAGGSGIKDLSSTTANTRMGVVLKPDSNTNLLEQRTLIPMLQSTICTDKEDKTSGGFSEYILMTGIFAVTAQHGVKDMNRRWKTHP